ncbi:MAG: hypothetical protein LBI95_01095 [Holosporales bacterium]|jgi:hypothetical protein|nr:hypothetical protein [Holosporales bacterium]
MNNFILLDIAVKQFPVKNKELLLEYRSLCVKSYICPLDNLNRHHICPKSLAKKLGYSKQEYDNEDNIAKLSIKDHVYAHFLLHKIFGGLMTYAFHHFTKSVPKWQDMPDMHIVIDEIAQSIADYQRISSKMRRGRKLKVVSVYDAVTPLEGINLYREGLNLSTSKNGKIIRTPKNLTNKRYCGRTCFKNKLTGKLKYVFRDTKEYEEFENDVQYKKLTYLTPHESLKDELICPWCGFKGYAPGILGYHFDFCKENPNAVKRKDNLDIQAQEILGNLTTLKASKSVNISVPQFMRIGKRLFQNKIIPRGRIVFWTRNEIDQIHNYQKLTVKERREINGVVNEI